MLVTGDCLEWMRSQPDDSVELTFGSPPYEDARKYDMGFSLTGQAWVDWMVERWVQMDRICSGLVAMAVEGRTKNFRWSATPALLMADLHRRGIKLRKPPIYHRSGIFGSGGPEWWRNDYELIVCSSKGRLPWSDNTAMGHPPKYPPGGNPSHRKQDGSRVSGRKYVPPKLANPGNVIHCVVGGGHMGDSKAHQGEAPFPESLAEHFIRSFCPPGGIVLDPFSGTGTTCAVAAKHGRRYIGIDIREDQAQLARERIHDAHRKSEDR